MRQSKDIEYLREFKNNLVASIEYYKNLFPQMVEETESYRRKMLKELQNYKVKLEDLIAANRVIFGEELQPAGV